METEGDRGTVSGWAVFLAMVVLKLTTLSSDGRIQALIIRRANSAKYCVPHPLYAHPTRPAVLKIEIWPCYIENL